jgi:hypothetical protein
MFVARGTVLRLEKKRHHADDFATSKKQKTPLGEEAAFEVFEFWAGWKPTRL